MVNSGKYFSVCTIYPVGANIVRPRPYDFGLPGRTLCAPYGITSQTAIYRCKRLCRLISLSDNLFFPSDWARACRDWRVQPYGFTATCVPARSVVDSLPLRRKPRWLKQPTGLFLRATFRIHNHLPPKQKKDIPFWNVLLFWWKVVDSNHRSHRRQIYSLFPLATRETFHIQLPA